MAGGRRLLVRGGGTVSCPHPYLSGSVVPLIRKLMLFFLRKNVRKWAVFAQEKVVLNFLCGGLAVLCPQPHLGIPLMQLMMLNYNRELSSHKEKFLKLLLCQDPLRSFTGRDKYKRPSWMSGALENSSVVSRISFNVWS